MSKPDWMTNGEELDRAQAVEELRKRMATRYALFVWHTDSRYRMVERIDGTTLYATERSAQRVADAMNARGEHGGMVIVRAPLDQVTP